MLVLSSELVCVLNGEVKKAVSDSDAVEAFVDNFSDRYRLWDSGKCHIVHVVYRVEVLHHGGASSLRVWVRAVKIFMPSLDIMEEALLGVEKET